MKDGIRKFVRFEVEIREVMDSIPMREGDEASPGDKPTVILELQDCILSVRDKDEQAPTHYDFTFEIEDKVVYGTKMTLPFLTFLLDRFEVVVYSHLSPKLLN